jgi:hypothetical protein
MLFAANDTCAYVLPHNPAFEFGFTTRDFMAFCRRGRNWTYHQFGLFLVLQLTRRHRHRPPFDIINLTANGATVIPREPSTFAPRLDHL